MVCCLQWARLAPDLVAAAKAPDGLIEAVELPGECFVAAVQWHPEELYTEDRGLAALFQAFVQASATYAAQK